MLVHDWSKIDVGLFHYVHRNWYRFIRTAINRQVLPTEYDIQLEKRTALLLPDVTPLNRGDGGDRGDGANRDDVPRSTGDVESYYLSFDYTLTVRRKHDDQLVAIVDIIPPGDRSWVDKRLRKAVAAGVHLLMIDVHEKGRSLSNEVPLYLEPDKYVLLPLDMTYTGAVYSIPSVFVRDIPSLARPRQTSTDE